MRKGLIGFVIAVALASAMVTNGCGSSSSGGGAASKGGSSGGGAGGFQASGGSPSGGAGNSGSQASGGSSASTSAPADCPNGSSCGGDVVGTWKVTSSCLNLSGDMNVELLGMGCPSVPITGTMNVTGTWTANVNGTYADNTTTTGSITFPLSASCLMVSSVKVECSKMGGLFEVQGWPATCSLESGQCNCSATANKAGGIGVVSLNAEKSGRYTISNGGLNTDDAVDYSYCVSGKTLTLTPKPTILPVKGTVVLQNTSSGTGGSTGGSTGAGGTTTSSGGASGTGGATTGPGGTSTGSGGRSGSGGAGGVTTGAGGTTAGTAGRSGTGGTTSAGGTTSTGVSSGSGPCDIYAAASNKCVAAHSTVRALFGAYNGPLYQVKRKSDNTTKDIGVLSPGGIADSSTQDTFCSGTTCVITKVYDQSGNQNYLSAQTSDAEDPTVRPASNVTNHTASNATQEQLTVGGKKVYSLYMKTAQAYWRDGSKTGVPTGSSPQGIYMVTSGKHVNGGCCFDYGNGPTSRKMSGGGTMDSLYFGTSTQWGSGNGTGPWVMADLEGGIYAKNGGGKNDAVLSLPYTYVTAVEKNNGTTEFQLKGSDATTGKLSTFYKGGLPSGYSPMKKEGAIVLGSGGDCCYSNSNGSEGTFYEGAIVAGYPSDVTDDAVHANVVSAGYGK